MLTVLFALLACFACFLIVKGLDLGRKGGEQNGKVGQILFWTGMIVLILAAIGTFCSSLACIAVK